MGGVDAFDVEGRIGLRVAERLGLDEAIGEAAALVAHLGQDEVAGAVDDAGDPFDMVGRQALAHRLDDRDAAGHRRLEAHHHPPLARGGEDLVAVAGDQGLVGGHHVLAVGDGPEHQFKRRGVAADQLDDDLDLRVVHHREGVVADTPDLLDAGDAVALVIARGGVGDLDAAAGPPRDLPRIAGEHGHRAAADGA